jgi:hypothetical protein
MAKTIGPLMSMTASGKFGNAIVFDKRGRARKYVIPANPQTANQVTQRNKIRDLQSCLKQLGAVLRAELKAGFGSTWNSMIIKELLMSDAAALDAYVVLWTAFQAGEKTAWGTADPGTYTDLTDGQGLYACASAADAIATRLGVTLTLTTPANDNGATVGAEWIDDTV